MAGAYIGVRLPDVEGREVVREVLSYESAVRKVPAGRAFAELVLEGADFSAYPEEVRQRLREIAGSSEDDSVRGLIPEFDGGGETDG